MDQTTKNEQFVRELTIHQNRLYGYVFSLLGDHNRTSDVVQETNLVLWRKIDEFDASREFLPWAFAIARFQVLAHLRDKKRDRILLDSQLAELLSEQVERNASQFEHVRVALRACIKQLTPRNRELVQNRYFKFLSVSELAESTGRKLSTVKVALMRSRQQLGKCVQQRLLKEEGN